MENFSGLLLMLVVAAVAVAVMKKGAKSTGSNEKKWPYVARKAVLTEIEQVLYWRLFEAMPGMIVLAQVGLSRVIYVPKSTATERSWFAKISQKSVDFVVCRKDGSTVVAIELDDRSHKGREKEDGDKERALNSAGIALIRWNVKNLPSAEEIKREISQAMIRTTQSKVA